MNKKLIVAVDFGNNTLSVAAAYKNSDNSLELLDFQEKELKNGAVNGILQNPNNILPEINEILQTIENGNKIKIGGYVFGLEPYTLRSEIKTIQCLSKGNDDANIKALNEEASKIECDDGRKMLVINQLERQFGSNIKGDFCVTSTSEAVNEQIVKIVNNFSSERTAKYMLSPMVEADAFLSDEDKHKGTLLIDFGAEITSFALYKDGLLRLCAVVPLGGIHITQDIRERFEVTEKNAEELKIIYGKATCELLSEADKNRGFNVRSDDKIIKVHLPELIKTIEARQCEIINFILQEIDNQHFNNLYNNIVVVGGASNLNLLPELLQKLSGKNVVKFTPKPLKKENLILNNSLLIAILAKSGEDCSAIVKPKPDVTPKKPRKPPGFFDRFKGVPDMFKDEHEKKM